MDINLDHIDWTAPADEISDEIEALVYEADPDIEAARAINLVSRLMDGRLQ